MTQDDVTLTIKTLERLRDEARHRLVQKKEEREQLDYEIHSYSTEVKGLNHVIKRLRGEIGPGKDQQSLIQDAVAALTPAQTSGPTLTGTAQVVPSLTNAVRTVMNDGKARSLAQIQEAVADLGVQNPKRKSISAIMSMDKSIRRNSDGLWESDAIKAPEEVTSVVPIRAEDLL